MRIAAINGKYEQPRKPEDSNVHDLVQRKFIRNEMPLFTIDT